jgi:CDP-4-dehydro-6-deoxyglucose reductase
MAQLLTLSRAARLVGVTRGALQKKIKDGELPTFEGQVQPEDLLRVYPQASLPEDELLARISHLKEVAYAHRLRERILPDPEVLVVRVAELGRELANARAELARFRAAATEGEAQLDALAARVPSEWRAALASLREHFRARLDQSEDAGHHQLAVRDNFMRVMVAHVLVKPSGREFFVEGSDTLLDAALRAGLALNYGCSNGNCGLCKAKVVSGQVKKVRNHDYVLNESDKLAGAVLMCCHTAVTDCVIEADEAGSAREIPLQQIDARVKSIDRLGADMMRLHLQTPRTRRLRFLAGQYVTLQANDAPPVDYPIASCPCDDRNLQFHVHRMPNNPFADLVGDGLKSGDSVRILGPRGDFVLREGSPHTLVFIAFDTGFAPIKSLIEHAMALDVAESIHLYWLASPLHGHYLANQCRAWGDALDNFHFTALELPEAEVGDPARLRAELMRVLREHPVLRDCDMYVAGSPALLDAARELLIGQGLPAEQLVLGYPR